MKWQAQCEEFQKRGFVVVPGLFSTEEVEGLRGHYMKMRSTPQIGDDWPLEPENEDPLRRFPRIIHPHRFDSVSLDFLLDPRLGEVMEALLGVKPLGVQTMIYFKPPGSRGQALHQDQLYLRVKPGTCLAAWLALDDCDDENGCLQVVPGTQDLPILCTIEADKSVSFTGDTVPIPEGLSPTPVIMKAGDILFFNGSIIHGSGPNTSPDRFRRSLIGHYAEGHTDTIGKFYHEAWTFDRQEIKLGIGSPSGPCGEFVDAGAWPRIAMRELGLDADQKGPH